MFAIYMSGAGLAELVCGYLFMSIFRRISEKMVSSVVNVFMQANNIRWHWYMYFGQQTYRLRTEYLKTLLRQDIAWFDTVQDKNFVSKISE